MIIRDRLTKKSS